MKKKGLVLAIILSGLVLGSSSAYASDRLMSSVSNVKIGDAFTVSLSLEDVAAWNIHIGASGLVEGCKLDTADVTMDALNTEKSFTVNCKALGVGVITVNLYGDYTSEDGDTENLLDSIQITVEKDEDKAKDDVNEKDSGYGRDKKGEGEDEKKSDNDLGKADEKEENRANSLENNDGNTKNTENTDDSAGSAGTGVFYNNGSGFAQGLMGLVILMAVVFAVLIFRSKKQKKERIGKSIIL